MSEQTGPGQTWWWRQTDHGGGDVTPQPPQEFPGRSEAESWLGEAYADLSDDGVASVTLFEGDREVYGPMSLEP